MSEKVGKQNKNIGSVNLAKHLEQFKYKGEVEIPALGMVNYMLTIAESGYKTAQINAIKIEIIEL